MVSDQRSIGRRASSPHGRLGRKAFLPFAVLGLALLLGCVSRGGPSHDQHRLAELVAESPSFQPEDVAEGGRPSTIDKLHLHVVGVVECGGFVSKTQTSYAEAWVTRPGPDGPRVKTRKLDLRLEYLEGVFQNRVVKKKREGAKIVRSSDVLHGNFSSDPCSCVRFTANADTEPLRHRLRARVEVCPGA